MKFGGSLIIIRVSMFSCHITSCQVDFVKISQVSKYMFIRVKTKGASGRKMSLLCPLSHWIGEVTYKRLNTFIVLHEYRKRFMLLHEYRNRFMVLHEYRKRFMVLHEYRNRFMVLHECRNRFIVLHEYRYKLMRLCNSSIDL